MRHYRKVVLVLLAGVLIAATAGAAYFWWQSYVRSPLHDTILVARQGAIEEEPEPVPTEILLNVPGVTQPTLAQPNDPRIKDTMRVIGIVVDGRAWAYSVKALGIPSVGMFKMAYASRHVVNQLIGNTAVSITYCDASRCARVFYRPNQTHWLNLGVGGVFHGQMLLCYEGKQYLHQSQDVPLPDLPYEVTTWKRWKERHPDSQIYLGE